MEPLVTGVTSGCAFFGFDGLRGCFPATLDSLPNARGKKVCKSGLQYSHDYNACIHIYCIVDYNACIHIHCIVDYNACIHIYCIVDYNACIHIHCIVDELRKAV